MNSVLTSVQFTGAGENSEDRRAYMCGTWLVLGTHVKHLFQTVMPCPEHPKSTEMYHYCHS